MSRSVWREWGSRLLAATLLLGSPFVASAADLQISSIADGAFENSPAGAPVTYTVTIGNGGTPDGEVASIYDLPAGTSAGTLPAFCATPDPATPTRVVCNHGELGLDEEVTFGLEVLTAGLEPGTIQVAGAIGFASDIPASSVPVASLDPSSDAFFSGDTNVNNNVSNETTTLVDSADLSLSMVGSPDPVVGGGEITYTLTVRNEGPSSSAGFSVVDALPASLTYAGGLSGSGWALGATGGGEATFNYTGPALAPGATTTFSFRAQVNIGTGNVVNTADVQAGPTADTVPGNNVASVTTAVSAGADVRISKTASPMPAVSGQPITFSIVVTNDGPSAAENVAFTDAMPTGFLITGGNQPTGWTCTTNGAGTQRGCQTSSLAGGASASFTITADVPSTGANSMGDVTNDVTVTSSTPDPVSSNNNDSVTFTVLPDGADLQLSQKTKTPALVAVWQPGDDASVGLMTSTMRVRNLGPRAATGNVQIADTLADGEAFVAVVSPQWDCAAVPVSYTPGTPQVVTCTLNTISTGSPLAVNSNAPDLVLTTRAMAASSNLANRACTGGSGGSGEPTTGNLDLDRNTDNDCSGLIGTRTTDERADLRISKEASTANGDRVLDQSEDAVTYTLTVSNDGPNGTAGVVINDSIPGYIASGTNVPDGTDIVADASGAPGFTCGVSGGSVVCRSGNSVLASGASATVVLTVSRGLIDSIGRPSTVCGGETVADAWCNTARVAIEPEYPGSVGEYNPSNNEDSDWVQVERVTNIQTQSKTVTPSTGQIGVDTTYQIAYRNNGPSTAPGVVFRDVFTLDAGDAGFVLRSANRTGAGTQACSVTHGSGITAVAAAGGTSYAANGGGSDYTVTVTCAPLSMARASGQTLSVVIRPNIDSGNVGRTFVNRADFYLDIDGDGVPDPAVGSSGGISYNYNSVATAADDEKTASLPFGSGSVYLITNKIDRGTGPDAFVGGIDPLGYDALVPDNNFITYRVTVQNTGPSVANNVRVADTITPPAGRQVRFVGASQTPTGTFLESACSVVSGGNPATGPGSQTLDCQMPGAGFGNNVAGVVAAGATSTLYLRYRYETAPAAGGDTMLNSVTASAAETNTSPEGSYTADEDTTIRARADVGVSKTMVLAAPQADPTVGLPPSVSSVTLRQPFHYVIEAENAGPGASLSRERGGSSPENGTGTVITDTLPAGVLVTGPISWRKVGPDPGGDEVPNGSGTCALTGSTITCNVGDVTVTGRVRVIVPARWDTYPAGGTSSNTATVTTEQVDLVPENDNVTVPLEVTRASIEGVVFEDRDRAGANGGVRQSAAAEPGIAGVTIALSGTDAYGNEVNLTTQTAADGSYSFTNLSPADASGYTLVQTQPAGYINGPQDPPTAGANAPSLGGTYAAGSPDSTITAIPVDTDEAGLRYNFPEVRRPSLSGFVYVDADFDNARDAGSDAPIAGATVELLDAGTGTVVATTSTDANGAYSFDDLDPLVVYTLREVLPSGNYRNRPTAVNAGLVGGAACDSGCTPGTGIDGDAATTDRISLIDLGEGLDGTGFNFGEDAIAAISGSVYVDRNGNGDFDAGDSGTINSRPNGGLEGVSVTLTGAGSDGVFGNADDPAPVTVQTDSDGAYRFEDLVVGQDYRVTETQPAGYSDGTENSSNVADVANLPPAGATGIDFGERLGSLAGVVFEDFSSSAANNNNGDFDTGENPIANATLTLTGVDIAGNPVSVAVQTGADGAYLFADLFPPQAGTFYTVTQTQPAGYIDGLHTPGNAATPGSATTANVIDGIAINAGQDATGYLFGELANAIISGTVYVDRNDDGDQAGAEPGIPGVTVTIQGAGPDGAYGTADDPAPVTLTTNADGGYSYGGAVTGQDYRIDETQPTGLASGQENTGNTITLTNLPASGSSGNDFGELAGSLSGSVWLDANNNGVRDAGEAGIAGVNVSLPAGTVDALGNPVVAATTDATGAYRFDDLLGGNYTVTQQAQQPVVGGVATVNGTTLAGTISGTSVGTATPVATVPSAVSGIALPPGAASVDNDFGETLAVSASGRVFFDGNNDGVQAGASETGIEGVEITLTGTDDSGAAVQLSTTTDSAGDFSFDGLRPGSYTIAEPTQPPGTSNGQTIAGNIGGVVSGTATPIGTVPSAIGSVDLTTPGSASEDNLFAEIPLNSAISGRVWRDNDNDGVFDASEEGIGAVVVQLRGTDLAGNTISRDVATQPDGSFVFSDLPPGEYTLTEPDQPVGTLNGITVPGSGGGTATPPETTPSTITGITLGVGEEASGNDFGEVPAGSIAGRVYNDTDNDGVVGASEAGIAGVELVLSGTDDLGRTVSESVTTDSEGRYVFEGLRPGTYTVTEPTQPPHTLNGITTAGTVDGASTGVATLVGTTPSAISDIALPAGGQSIDNNFGEIGDSPDLVVTKAADPSTFTVNNTGSYTIQVRNAGQQSTQGEYTVEDRLPAGLTLDGTPSGNGWACDGVAGDSRFRCVASTPIAPGTTLADAIVADVRVDASAANGSPVINAVLVEGGGENDYRAPTTAERADFNDRPGDLPVCEATIIHNACHLPTPVQLAASLSGSVWYDRGADFGLIDGGDGRLGGWTVEVVDAEGEVVATTTAADGSYSVADLIPGVRLGVRFRDPASGVLWGWPVSGETAAGPPAPCDAEDAIANGTASSCRSEDDGTTRLSVVLAAGADLPQQSLPINPGGVVYDAVTRDPVPGSRVTLAPVGTCPGYSPESHLLNAASGGYTIDGDSVSMTVGAEGFYQFLMGPTAPASCRFRISVVPPAGYSFASTMIPAEDAALNTPATPGVGHPVQPNATAPTAPAGSGTVHYLELNLGSGVAAPVHNHLPLDSMEAPGLVISKAGDRKTVEVGDSMVYTITIRQTAGAALGTVQVIDRLPHGFTFIAGTARVDGAGIADPLGEPGPTLVFDVGELSVGSQKVLSYRVRVGVGSQQGDGINRARAHGCSIQGGCVDPDTLAPYTGGGVVASNPAEYRVTVRGGVFADEGCVVGKIFVDCNVNHVQDREELGIPGVRMYFEDGTWLISDSEGKYSYCGLEPKSHTLKVDATTLPVGSRLTTSSNRNLGDADSLFIDLKNGELHRADFIEGSCSNPVLEQVKARRTQGEVRAPESEASQPPLRFESKPVRVPQQGTDSANQSPIVAPRQPAAPRDDAAGEVQP